MSFPKSLPLRLSPKARQDFIDILRYTGEAWGQKQLLIYRDKIDDALKMIAFNPGIGLRRRDLPSNYMTYLVASHIIVYRVNTDGIGVARILHQRMSVSLHV